MEIGSLFNMPSPPDIYRRMAALPTHVANAVNSFIPINPMEETADDREVASITNSSRSHHQGFTTSAGTTPGDSSRSGIHSEHSAFSVYLRDSRMNPSEFYIPDRSGKTITQRAGNWYGYLPNEHEASLVKIELFIPYFETNLFVIDHHTGDLYLYNRDNRGVELLAIQATKLPISPDQAKTMAQMCANSW